MPEETPKETPEQSGAPADDHINVPLTEEEITILTSGEEDGRTAQQDEEEPRDQPRPVEVISIDLNKENTPIACKWGSFVCPSDHTYIY